jgi:cell division protein FtsB
MPAASAHRAGARRPPRAAQPGRRRSAPIRPSAAGRVRWDRLGRIALLCVLVALVYLYVSAGLQLLSTLHQSHRDSAAVTSMEVEHLNLARQHQALSGQAALEAQARQLGMMRKGEQPYFVSGLPKN